MKKSFILTLALAWAAMAWADLPFRNQRYDALNVVDVNEQSIVFVGNSITNMHEWFDAFQSDQKVLGFGVSGAVSTELVENIEASLVGHPAKIFILIGTNDLGTYNNSPDIPTAKMREVLRRITKESPNTEVYVQAVLPTCGNYSARVQYTKALNKNYKECVEELNNEKVHYLDIFTPLLKSSVLNSNYTADGLHMYASGYQVWCHEIEDEVGIMTTYPAVSSPLSNPTITGYSGSFLMRASYFKTLPVNDGDILIVGDDMAHQGEWHNLLHSAKVKNRGSGWGYNSLNVQQMTQVIPTILHDNPSPAQIWLNIAHKDANNSVTKANFKKYVEEFISTAKKNLREGADTKFVLAAIHPSNTAATNTNYIVKYNAAMKEIADADETVDYVDTYTPLLSGSTADTNYLTDGRLYGMGYIKMAQTMLAKIQEADPNAYVWTEDEAQGHYDLVQARNKLGKYIGELEAKDLSKYDKTLVEALNKTITEAWDLLATNATTDELGRKYSALEEAFEALTADVQELTITVDMTNGSFTTGNTNFNSNWRSNTDFYIDLNCGVNNMSKNGNNLLIYSGTALSSTYTISAETGWRVAEYKMTFKAYDSAAVGVALTTCDNQSFSVKATAQTVEVKDWTKEETASFTIKGANKGIELTDFTVKIVRSTTKAEEQVEVFTTTGIPNYRIPAIATTKKGTVIAVADYRYGGSDIGYGSVELRRRTSTDNGKTWGALKEFTNGSYATSPTPKYDAAYGDPCIVADRTSDRQMIMSCSGNTGFPNGTRQVHQGITRFYSTDEGKTWSDPVNLESMFYSMFDEDCTRGPIKSMFIGSGKICQSRIIKTGDYYRLYCAGLVKDKNGTNCNYVFYSDDFGENWYLLGDKNTPPIPSGADEPKAEELPDGSVICSSRTSGRWFNIFTYTNSAKAEGSWATVAKSDKSNNGVYGASCNGEIMIVPATRNSDGKDVYLALHSIPAADSRINVSIYYKGLADFSAWATPATFAANWEGKHQASKMGSAYSTMIMMPNDHVGFLYEESTHGADYTIVFKDYSIEQITDSAYSYNPDLKRADWVADNIESQIDALFENAGTYLGMVDITKKAVVLEAVKKFRETGTIEDYEAITTAINSTTLKAEEGEWYTLKSNLYTSMYLSHNGTQFKGLARDESDATQMFQFVNAGNEGEWKIYNPSTGLYFQKTPAVYKEATVTTSLEDAGVYTLSSSTDGKTAFICTTPTTSTYPALCIDAVKKIVAGKADAKGSLWFVERVDPETGIESLTPTISNREGVCYDLSGRKVSGTVGTPGNAGLYIKDNKKYLVK